MIAPLQFLQFPSNFQHRSLGFTIRRQEVNCGEGWVTSFCMRRPFLPRLGRAAADFVFRTPLFRGRFASVKSESCRTTELCLQGESPLVGWNAAAAVPRARGSS